MAENFELRPAVPQDLEDILVFLKENFPLRKEYYQDRDFFLNEFQGKNGALYFWLAVSSETGEILGVSSYYKANQELQPDIVSGIWCVKEADNLLLGFLLRRQMIKELQPRCFCGTTTVEKSLPAHRRFTKYIEVFKEYRWILPVNQKIQDCTDLIPVSAEEAKNFLNQTFSLGTFDFEKSIKKDADYIYRRYFSSPQLQYQVMYLPAREVAKAIVVIKQEKESLFVIDYLGKETDFTEVCQGLGKLAQKNKCRQIILLGIGFDTMLLQRIGFKETTDEINSVAGATRQLYGFSNQPLRMCAGDGVFESIYA